MTPSVLTSLQFFPGSRRWSSADPTYTGLVPSETSPEKLPM